MHDRINHHQLSWLPELTAAVRRELSKLSKRQDDRRPALEQEIKDLDEKIAGWSESLANPNLPPALRLAIETKWSSALDRKQEVGNTLIEWQAQSDQADCLIEESDVLKRVERLADVLASNNPTAGNLHLSLHIDRIECGSDGRVVMKSCKLGSLTDAIPILAEKRDNGDAPNEATNKSRHGPRQRGRLRVDDCGDESQNMRLLADFAANPDRFAGLGDDWFWIDDFQIPERPPTWVVENAESVFRRRQEGKLSHAKLAAEFKRSKPTIRAAIQCYLEAHPEAKDEVNLPSGGARPPKFDLDKFGDEARQLWENGWSKLKLADKYDCSTPTIDKALAFAYEKAGLKMPTREDRQNAQAAEARQLLDGGASLEEIAEALKVSDVTARQLLRLSFAAEGKSLPDLRCRRGKT